MSKVWNVTGGPGSEASPTVLMLFGKRVLPGHYVKVDASQLKNAHKTMKDVEAGLVHIGDKLPDSYLAAKAPVRARLPRGHVRSHGEQAAPAKAPAPRFRKVVTEVTERSEGKSKKTGK